MNRKYQPTFPNDLRLKIKTRHLGESFRDQIRGYSIKERKAAYRERFGSIVTDEQSEKP